MPIVQTMVDDPDVGKGLGDYFKPNSQKQRIAIIPDFISLADLVVPDDIRAKAGTDASAREMLEYMLKRAELLKDGADAEPPRAIKMTRNGAEGYRYCRMDSAYTHYNDTVHYYLCKAADYKAAGREAECCKASKAEAEAKARASGKKLQGEPGAAQLLYGFIVLVYNTDAEGNILKLAQEARRPLDDKHKLDFKYEFRTWAINDAKMKGLKQYTKKFPPIGCDFEVWEQKVGASDRVMFSPVAPPALWLARGPVLEEMILKEAEKQWPRVARTVGKDLSIAELDELLLGTPTAPTKPKAERNFAGLIS